MSRRQATKTCDSSSPAPESSMEVDGPAVAGKADSLETKTQLELNPPPPKDPKVGGTGPAVSSGKTSESKNVSIGAEGESEVGAMVPSKDSCRVETLDKTPSSKGTKLMDTLQNALAGPEQPRKELQPANSNAQSGKTEKDASATTVGGNTSETPGTTSAKNSNNPQSGGGGTKQPSTSTPSGSSNKEQDSATVEATIPPKDSDPDVSGTADSSTEGSTPVKGSSAGARSSFTCSCGRNFDTRRGLSIHLAHEPRHFSPADKKDLRDKDEGSEDISESAPSSPAPARDSTPPPTIVTTSAPSSPTVYNMSSFKTSSRNPQYYSIIRTRRNVNEATTITSSGAVPEVGRKRPCAAGDVTGPPAKAMLLSSGEKIPVHDEDESANTPQTQSESNPGSGKKKSKTSGETKGRVSGTSPSSPTALLSRAGVMQEFNLRSSPVTRSNTASRKAHEFISLPSYRKRGKKAGAGVRGVAWRAGGNSKLNISGEDNISEFGEDMDTSDIKSEDDRMESAESSVISVDDSASQPVKRKRGRPPKVRRDTPTTSPASTVSGGKAKSSPSVPIQPQPSPSPSSSSAAGPISSSTRSSKSGTRGAGKSSSGSGVQVKQEKVEEPSEAETGSKKDDSVISPPAPEPAKAKPTRKSKESHEEPSSAPVLSPPTLSSSPQKATSQQTTPAAGGVEKHVTVTRTRSKRAAAAVVSEETPAEVVEPSHGKKKASGKSSGGTKTPVKDTTTSQGTKDSSAEQVSAKSNESDSKTSPTETTPSAKELRSSKSKSKKGSAKSRKVSKSEKGEQKKSVSDTEEMDMADGAADSAKTCETVEEAEKEDEDPVPSKSQVAPRQSSVIVSVLSGSEKQEAAKKEEQPASGEAGKKEEEEAATTEKDKPQQKEQKDVAAQPTAVVAPAATGAAPRRMSETSPVFPYPSTSAPTAAYPHQFPPYPSFPPQHPMMYPTGPLSAPSTPMYPSPHFYPYPGSPPLQIPPPGAYFTGPPPPHMVPNTTGVAVEQGGLVSPQALHPSQQQQQAFNNTQQFPVPPATSVTSSSSSSAAPPQQVSTTHPTGSGPAPANVTSVATTVGGVRVSVLDNPPKQMVTLPYPMPSATAPRLPRPPPGTGYPMEMPPGAAAAAAAGVRAYMEGAPPGVHSPDGLEPRPPMPHPLTQVHRPGLIPMYPPIPMPHSPYHHPHIAVRVDHSGMPIPYIGWPGHDPRPQPSEELPLQPVECPECGRMFKNNKALNGHMRLHGGFDWTKKQPFSSDQNKQHSGSSSSGSVSSPKDGKSGQDDAKNKSSAPTTTSSSSRGVKRPRSKSGSRSRSNSPAPAAQGAAAGKSSKSNKRRKSSDDGAHTSKLVRSESSKSATKEDSTASVQGPLPTQRAPSIFTFDQHIQPHHSKAPVATGASNALSSTNASSPSSETQENGNGALTHSGSTLDDLCRAAAELERMDTTASASTSGKDVTGGADDSDDPGRSSKRPGNISIPQTQSPSPAIDKDRYRLGATPPYTPPPILSPSRSLIHLALGVGQANTSAPCTPNRIMQHWNSSYNRKVSETAEEGSFSEPKINVGEEFQAKLPQCSESRAEALKEPEKGTLVWKPPDNLTEEDESMIDGYLELACSPAVLHGGRNKELAVHYLHAFGGSLKEAVRWMLSGKTPFGASSGMTDYNYSGSRSWSGRERQQFRRAWKVHRKNFGVLNNSVESKSHSDLIEYYYTWKKYCSDEYRGRNRHISEEIFSDEDDLTYPQVPSSSSSGSGDSEHSHSTSDQDSHVKSSRPAKGGGRKGDRAAASSSFAVPASNSAPSQSGGANSKPYPQPILPGPHPQSRMFNNNLPIVYAPHSSPAVFSSQNVNHFPCKYPGCTQVFTSIFALNGHIRVHGGSFFPKPSSNGQESSPGPMGSSHSQMGLSSSSGLLPSASGAVASNSRLQQSSSAPSGLHYSATHKLSASGGASQHYHPHHPHAGKSFAEVELAKALLELPGSHSTTSTKSLGYHTPSPKPSPGKGKGLSGGGGGSSKKKLSSSSPGEHEGYYPCNRCGRVFGKVKSRSAHMKSHVIKSN